MNKRIFILSIITCILFGIILVGCNPIETSSDINSSLMDPITVEKNSINISVDPRIELLSIVQYLSDYKSIGNALITDENFNYKDRVRKHFINFENHEAVILFDQISKKSFAYDAPPTLMLFMNQEFGLRDDVELTEYLLMRAGGQQNVDNFFDALKNFYIETDFISFFNDNTEYYNNIIDNTLLLIDDKRNIISDLEEYYGMEQRSYNVVLVSLYGPLAYGPMIETINQGADIYSIVGCQMLNGNLDPSFGTRRSFDDLQFHEFSHSFINPLTSKNINLVNQYSSLFEPIRSEMSNMAYGSWEICLNEHIIRALTPRFIYGGDQTEGIMSIGVEEQNNFIYIKALYNKLKEYEDNRDKYPTIEDFYPELLNALNEYI